MRKKNCVITGAAGFIGANLTQELLKNDFQVNIIVKNTTSLWRLNKVKNNKNLHIYTIDLNNKNDLKTFFHKTKPNKIFHLASYGNSSSQNNLSKMIKVNILATQNVLEASLETDYDSLIITGSSSEYGFKNRSMKEKDLLVPESYYAATKASATLIASTFAKLNKKPIKILRLFSVYGPFEESNRLIPTLINSAIKENEINITKEKIKRDFIYIDDVINAIIKACNRKDSKYNGSIYNIGTGKQFTNKEITLMIQGISKKELNINYNFKPRSWDTNYWLANISKAQKDLKWKPKYDIKLGLKKSYAWYNENLNLYE